jgi:hypothetical protein
MGFVVVGQGVPGSLGSTCVVDHVIRITLVLVRDQTVGL